MQGLIIEPHYIPNLQYFSKFILTQSIIIDDISLFRKQSYRNRAQILSANGILSLIVPVCKGRSKIALKDVRIDQSILWQKNHWNSIISAYNKSAYFEYYKHLFEEFYTKKHTFLIDLNLDIIKTISSILSLHNEIRLFSEYTDNFGALADFRNRIDPKARYFKKDDLFTPIKYTQGFMDRFEFVSDLSIIDLIFNHGPDAAAVLQKSVIRPF